VDSKDKVFCGYKAEPCWVVRQSPTKKNFALRNEENKYK